MSKPPKSYTIRKQPSNWRDFQSGLKHKDTFRRPRPRSPLRRGFVAGLLAILVISGLLALLFKPAPSHQSPSSFHAAAPPSAKITPLINRDEMRQMLDIKAFSNLRDRQLELTSGGRLVKVETTLDTGLQNYLLQAIDRINSRYVGIVVIEASSGRVLALAGYDRTDPTSNPCLRSQYPAASIFKIVTAATAVDQCGFGADSPMHYSGPKHTLYKRQLTDRVDRYTTTIPLRAAFAESINPVFGKLGELRLRRPLLEKAAATFGFNQSLDFELPIPPSRFQINDEPYNWAEVASGFNLETTLSPLHGAMLVSSVLNGGRMVTPTIIEAIRDDQGKTVYERPNPEFTRVMTPRAAAALGQMMETTIASGTARKSFRHYRQDNVLSRLQLGGKTGSIDNASHDVRFDWFVGFAKESQGEKQIAVAVMVGHERFIGIRAGEYARKALTYYFSHDSERGTQPK